MAKAEMTEEERNAKDQEMVSMFKYLDVISEDKNSFAIVQAVIQAIAARCMMDLEG